MQFLQLVISGVAQGCIYGLIALGFVLIYKATETVSFVQGDLMMLGAFVGLVMMTVLDFPFWIAVISAILGMGLAGIALERVVIRPILGQPAFSIVMLTIGIGYVLRGLVTMIPNIGTDTHTIARRTIGTETIIDIASIGTCIRGGPAGLPLHGVMSHIVRTAIRAPSVP